MSTFNAALRRLRQRLGVREEVIAAVAIALMAVGGISFTLITHTGTPAGAALAYMAALDRADTDYVWTHSIIDTARVSSAGVSLVDRAALNAQLNSTAHTRSGFAVQGVSFASDGTKVTLSYQTSDGLQSSSLIMWGGAPHSWPVLLQPAVLDLNLPPGAGSVAIDGRKIDTTAGTELKVAVLPGRHKLSMDASQLYLSYAADFDKPPLEPRPR